MKNIKLGLLNCLLLALIPLGSVVADDSRSVETFSATAPAQLQTRQSSKLNSVVTQAYQSHVWFHSVDIYLSGDINSNGYYHRLEVEFDADTSVPYQQVFAEFTLLPTYGAERLYYTSSVFELFRESSDDWLAVDTVLDQHFAVDDYLLTIRLFDAQTGYLLAEISGFDDSSLDYIPLEDYGRDSYHEDSSSVEVSAGSTGILALLALCLLQCRRFAKRSSKAE